MAAPQTTIVARPLGSLNAAMRDLDASADHVRALVEQGSLIAFNIAARPAHRAELRILTRSLEHYRQHAGKVPHTLEWPAIFRIILPQPKPFIRGVDVARYLNCDRGHIENLITAKCLILAKKAKPGPGGSPLVTCASLEQFLIGGLQ